MLNQMQGPFNRQLEQPYEAPRNPAGEAGMGGPMSGIAHAATNFLEGMAKSRLANQYRAEMQRQKNISAVTALMQHAENSDLTPAAKQQFNATMMQRLAHEVAGASGGDKKQDSSNPVVNWFKQAANSIVGPNPGKVAPIDDAFLGQAFQTLQSAPKISQVQEDALAKMQQAMRESTRYDVDGKTPLGVSGRKLMQHPAYMEAVRALQSSGITALPPTWKIAESRVLSPEDESLLDGRIAASQWGRVAAPESAPPPSIMIQPQGEARPTSDGSPLAGDMIAQSFAAPQAAQQFGGNAAAEPVTAPTSGPTILGPVQPVTPEIKAYLHRLTGSGPTKYYLEDPKNDNPSILVEDYGNGIRIQAGTGKAIAPDAEARGYVNSGLTPKFAKKDGTAMLQSGVNLAVTEAQAAGLSEKDLERVRAAYSFGAGSGEYDKGMAAARNVINNVVALRNHNAAVAERRASGQLTPAQRSVEERSLRSRWDNAPIMRNWTKLASNYRTVQNSLALKDGAGDVAAIKAFMIMTDPQTGVRDAEYVVGQSIGGPWEQFRADIDRVAGGSAKMTDATRTKLLRAANAMYSAGKMDRDEMFDAVTAGAAAIGADPRRIVTGYSRIKQEIEREASGKPGEQSAPGADIDAELGKVMQGSAPKAGASSGIPKRPNWGK